MNLTAPRGPQSPDDNEPPGALSQDERPAYQPPPRGWVDFGTHADTSVVCYGMPLEFSEAVGLDWLPLWERHKDWTTCDAPFEKTGVERG